MTKSQREATNKMIHRLAELKVQHGDEHAESYKKASDRIKENESNVDLFEDIDALPKEVQKIILDFDYDEDLYAECKSMLAKLEKLGYTFEYGLCGTPFNLRKINQN